MKTEGNATLERVHSRTGVDLVRALAAEGDRIFTSERARALAPTVGMSEGYLRQALHHLVKAGWLVRLRRGLYAITSMPGVTPAREFEVAMHLVEPAAIAFRSAMHYHEMTEQIPRVVYVLTTTAASVPRDRNARESNARTGVHRIGSTDYQFVQVKPERYFGISKIWINEVRVSITDPERTLVDGLMMPKYCGDFAEVLHAFETSVDRLDIDRIIEYSMRLDAAVAMRLGWVLESFGVDPQKLGRLHKVSVKGYRSLDPSGPRKGPCNSRWMIQENLPGRLGGRP